MRGGRDLYGGTKYPPHTDNFYFEPASHGWAQAHQPSRFITNIYIYIFGVRSIFPFFILTFQKCSLSPPASLRRIAVPASPLLGQPLSLCSDLSFCSRKSSFCFSSFWAWSRDRLHVFFPAGALILPFHCHCNSLEYFSFPSEAGGSVIPSTNWTENSNPSHVHQWSEARRAHREIWNSSIATSPGKTLSFSPWITKYISPPLFSLLDSVFKCVLCSNLQLMSKDFELLKVLCLRSSKDYLWKL